MFITSKIKNYAASAAAVLLIVAATSAISSQRGGAVTGAPVPIVNTNEAQQTFCKTVYFTFTGSGYGSASIVVPAGKRLVIETVSCFASVFAGDDDIATATIGSTTHGNIGYTQIVMVPQRTAGGYINYSGTQQVKLYADAGTSIILSVNDTQSGSDGSGYFTVSGYYVNTP